MQAPFAQDLPSVMQILIGTLGATLIAGLSYRLQFLSFGGAIAQWLMGVIIFAFGGWSAAIPIIVFFSASSILSRFADPRRQTQPLDEKGSSRDAFQVAANGGIAAGLVVLGQFVHDGRVYQAYVGALTAAAADTFATEIGTVYGRRARLITSLRLVTPGSSGAVTFQGLLGSL